MATARLRLHVVPVSLLPSPEMSSLRDMQELQLLLGALALWSAIPSIFQSKKLQITWAWYIQSIR